MTADNRIRDRSGRIRHRPSRSTGAIVPAAPTHKLLAELADLGWTKAAIAREFGLVRFHLADVWITRTNARLVADLHDAVTVHGHRPGLWRDPIAGLLAEIADISRSRTQPWRADAACAGLGYNQFERIMADGASLCDLCPVYDDCAAEGTKAHTGWWAGINLDDGLDEESGAA